MVDLATMGTALFSAYQAWGSGNFERQNAVMDTVMAEIAPAFAELFKTEGKDGIIPALNLFILEIYHFSPDFAQFFVRLMVNMWSEKNQRVWPKWISMPLIIFLRTYFGALEAATRDRKRPTLDDVRLATERLAEEARRAASELSQHLSAAHQAARVIDIPNLPQAPKLPDLINALKSLGGNMTAHTTTPPGDKKKKFEIPKAIAAGLAGGKEKVEGFFDALELAVDEGEDYAQAAVNGAYAAVVLGVITVLSLVVGLLLLLVSPVPLAVIVVNLSTLWLVGPLVGFTIWRAGYRKIAAAKEAAERQANPNKRYNPNNKPGNGVIEGGMLASMTAFMGGGSPIVVAIMCAIGAIFSFSWAYAFAGTLSIGLVFVTWVTCDLWLDLGKSVFQYVKKGVELKKGRITRTVTVVGIVWCAAMLPAMLNGILNHTNYMWDVVVVALYLALFAVCINIRINSVPGSAPVENLKTLLWGYAQSDYKASRAMLLAAIIVIPFTIFTINTILPPDQVVQEEVSRWKPWEKPWEKESPPSYGKRIQAWVQEARPPECTEETRHFVRKLEDDTCRVVLKESDNLDLVVLCEEAVECGALQKDGSKKGMGVAKAAPVARASMPEVGGGGLLCSLVAAIFLILVVVGLVKGEEKKKETGSAAHH